MADDYGTIVDRREQIDLAANDIPKSWADAALAQLRVQRDVHVQAIAGGTGFEAKDARVHVLALDRIRGAVEKQFSALEQPKRRGRPPKNAPRVIEPPSEAPLDGDERVRLFAATLCPQGWQDNILPVFETMADNALTSFLDATEMSQQDAARAEYKELQIFIKKLWETEGAGERARLRLLKRRVA